MFKLTTYSKFKSTVDWVVLIFTSTTAPIFEITVLRIVLVFLVFCDQVTLICIFWGSFQLSSYKFYFKNTLCVLHSELGYGQEIVRAAMRSDSSCPFIIVPFFCMGK